MLLLLPFFWGGGGGGGLPAVVDWCYLLTLVVMNTVMLIEILILYLSCCGFGGLGVACWPLVPKFAGSNPAEAVGFLKAKKSSARLPSEGK